MKLFETKKNKQEYDPEKYKPVIRVSICTGERVAGFKDRATGHIKEVMLIRSDRDLQTFRDKYHITDEKIENVY